MNNTSHNSWRTLGASLMALLILPAAAFSATHTIEIRNNFFSPANLTIDVGDTVTWIQRGFNHNTESFDPPGVWTSPILNLNQTFSFTFTTAGTFRYLCRPHAQEMRGVITVRAAANAPPSVSITSPANGATFPSPASVTIDAAASDSDGSVARVEFFDGAASLGVATTPPFSITATLAPGSHTLTARATDNAGASTTSAPVTITINPASAPTPATLSAPTRLPNGHFQFTVNGASGRQYVTQASANFASWTAIQTNTAGGGAFNVIDPAAANLGHRFYRVIEP